MMTSMSYSRYFRIAIAIAPGTPSSSAISVTTNATFATAELSHPHVSSEPNATPWLTRATAPANATHLICCRSSRPADRYRTISDPNAAPATATTVSTDTTSSAETASPSASIPPGFAIRNDTPPGAGTPYVTGSTMKPIVVMAAATRPTTRTGRHRGEGNRPVGNRNNMNPSAVSVGPNTHSAKPPATTAPGTDPGRHTSPATLYAPAKLKSTNPSATPCRIHPIGLRARRTMTAPRVA